MKLTNNMEEKIIISRKELSNCLLCHDAPCDVCEHFKVSDLLRSIWFKNEKVASLKYSSSNSCLSCSHKNCEKHCLHHVEISKILPKLHQEKKSVININYDLLKTNLCGIPLENPFLLSSSCVASNYEMIAKAFTLGWAGVAFKTICLMDIHEASPRFDAIKSDMGSFYEFKNIEQLSEHSLMENLKTIKDLKRDFPSKVILASIMGRTIEEWQILAISLMNAGADAIELNFSCPNMTREGTGSDIGQNPKLVEEIINKVKEVTKIPVIAKLTPNVASMLDATKASINAKVDGIAAINTIKSLMLPGELADNKVAIGGLSGRAVKPIALRFINEICSNYPDLYISAIGGIETYKDALDYIMLGASSVQITTAVMEYGYRIIHDLRSGLALYLTERNVSLSDIKGESLKKVVKVEDLERDIVIYPKFIRENCVHCLRCYISCFDGGHQAIKIGPNREPLLDPNKCVGCHLCILVCPKKAIISSNIKTPRNRFKS